MSKYPAHEVLAVLRMLGCELSVSPDSERLDLDLPKGLTEYQRRELVQFARDHKVGLLELLAGCSGCGSVEFAIGPDGERYCAVCDPCPAGGSAEEEQFEMTF